MFISKLNRFFERHGRKTFAVFTGIIIISFVLYFSPGFDVMHLFSSKPKQENIAGEISKEEFNDAFNSNMILISLQLGGAPLNDQFIQQMAYYRTLEWAVAAKIAEKNGISASDEDVVDEVKKIKLFQSKSGFDRKVYDQYITNVLNPFNFGNTELENAIRKDIIQKRLKDTIINSVIVSEQEIEDEYKEINTKVNAVLFSFKSENFTPQSVDEEELKAYFNANSEKYKIPPKSKALVARFNYIAFEDEAQKNIGSKDIEDYYNANKKMFLKEDKTEQPLDAVKEQVKKTLAHQKAVEIAYKHAQNFSSEVYKNYLEHQNKPLETIFEEYANNENYKKLNLVLLETDWFDIESKSVKNIGNEPEFAKAVSDLISDQPLSEPIRGQRAAFVALLTNRETEKQAQFEDVKDKVISEFKKLKAAKIANEKASETALSIVEKLAEAVSIDMIDAFKSSFASEIPEFTFASQPSVEYSYAISSLARKTPEGKVSEVTNTGTDSIFIFVKSKKKPENINAEEFEKFKEQYIKVKENTTWNNFLASAMETWKKQKK